MGTVLEHSCSYTRNPAHHQDLGRLRDKLHQGLRNAESSLAIQLCTKKTGFAGFLHARRVPDVIFPASTATKQKERKVGLSLLAYVCCFPTQHHRTPRLAIQLAIEDKSSSTSWRLYFCSRGNPIPLKDTIPSQIA